MVDAIKELQFIVEIDKLKSVLRQTLILSGERNENTAEHSWHLATTVLVLKDLSNEPVNLERALKMALIHDIVEIDAGDTFIYDMKGNENKTEREQKAAIRLFNLLEKPLSQELHTLWMEFEKQECPESKFVAAIDRFLPLMSNYYTEGHSWKKHGIKRAQVIERNNKIEKGSQRLWAIAKTLIDHSVEKAYLSP